MACVVACVLRDDGKAAQVSASGSHDGLMRPPVGLRNRWLSKEGLKGAVVGVVVFGCCNLWMAAFGGGSQLAEAVVLEGLRRRIFIILITYNSHILTKTHSSCAVYISSTTRTRILHCPQIGPQAIASVIASRPAG